MSDPVRKGMQAVGKVLGHVPPTEKEVVSFFKRKIPQHVDLAYKLVDLGVLPHIKISASGLALDAHENQQEWARALDHAGVNRQDRQAFIRPLVDADIALWRPLFEGQEPS